MKTLGILQRIDVSFKSRKALITFEVDADPEELVKYLGMKLEIVFQKFRLRRSPDANRMLWACLGDLAAALKMDTWSMYLYELEQYGKFTYIHVLPEAVEAVKGQWRETKVVGETPDGMVELLCFFGSSSYNTAEFSRLLDGVIGDMKDMGLTPPPTKDMQRALEEYERQQQKRERRKK